MSQHISSMPQANGNLVCAIDIETTGQNPNIHEICQIAVQPLTPDYKPHPVIDPFYTEVMPLRPEKASPVAMGVHGLSVNHLLENAPHPHEVKADFERWLEALELPFQRRIIMLAHNSKFENMFLIPFFGVEYHMEVFNANTRDTMTTALSINDKAFEVGKEPPFERVNMSYLTRFFNIVNPKAHDALQDAIAAATLYKKLLNYEVL